MKYIITKQSRFTNYPYSGVAFTKANVPQGKIYDSKDEAEADLFKLNQINPGSFILQERYDLLKCVHSSWSLLEKRFYEILEPEENDDEEENEVRVIDESGEDYLYPRNWFE